MPGPSLPRLTELRQNSCSSQQLPSHSSPPPVITLESLWLCTPCYYCQPIKTKASRIRTRIKLYTWERDLRGGKYYRQRPSLLLGSGPTRGVVARRAAATHLRPVLLFGVGVHLCESSQHQRFHQGPLHRAGQQVEWGAAAGELLRQVPPALALHHDVRPGQRTARFRQIYNLAEFVISPFKAGI